MGDSDEDYDRRRGRDKFRRERSDYQERGGREERVRRDEWTDNRREQWGKDRNRREYRDYDQRPDEGRPAKRMRRDWDDQGYSGYEGRGGYQSQNWGNSPAANANNKGEEGATGSSGETAAGPSHTATQPPMMSFKHFLSTQDDSISDEDAVKKFAEYKIDFKKQQLKEFFTAHKEEEWFRTKYHPEECSKRKQDQQEVKSKRLKIFVELQNTDLMKNVQVEMEKSEDIKRLLDAVVIKLEGGDEEDLKCLAKTTEATNETTNEQPSKSENEQKEPQSMDDSKETELKSELTVEPQQKREEESLEQEKAADIENEHGPAEGDKKKDENGESGSESEVDSEDGMGEENSESKHKKKSKGLEQQNGGVSATEEAKEDAQEGEIEEKEECTDETAHNEQAESQKSTRKKRVLPQTSSIYLRQLAPTITKAEVEAMCRKFPGFLRVALADPQPERKFFRRGWASFDRNVNIKEICWNLNSLRLRECELGATVNRDLTMRIYPGSHITFHKHVARADIQLVVKIIQNLDARHGLWEDPEQADVKQSSFGIVSKNPLLHNIAEYLVEEASAEEEELLGKSNESAPDSNGEIPIEKDATLLKVLDKLLLYLRIVHSVDYYNNNEYPNEDEMPNRCGIMHARSKSDSDNVSVQEVEEYIATFERKIHPFTQPTFQLSEDDCIRLGKKDVNTEVESFIKTNTTELGKNKYLCPLSGKKFQGPDYVRKHILTKHAERVEEVKKDVEFFNNYIRDPRRPQLPEHPGSKPPAPRTESNTGTQNHHSNYSGNYRGNQGYGSHGYSDWGYNRGGGGNYFGRRSGGRGGVGGSAAVVNVGGPTDPRELISYNDLDAPEANDIF